MVLGGQSREVIMLTDDNDHLPQPAASGHKRSSPTRSKFRRRSPHEWRLYGNELAT